MFAAKQSSTKSLKIMQHTIWQTFWLKNWSRGFLTSQKAVARKDPGPASNLFDQRPAFRSLSDSAI